MKKSICYNLHMKKIAHFFDKLEDKIRGHLSHYPIVYAIIGGFSVVLFWRAVWHTADILKDQGGILGIIFYEPVQILITLAVLLATGLMVSIFIGDQIIISGINHDKKLAEKTELEVSTESSILYRIAHRLEAIEKSVEELKKDIKK